MHIVKKFYVFLFLFQIPTSMLEEDGILAEFAVDTLEHPSPISVLDASVYRDGTPSPVKQISNVAEGNSPCPENCVLYVAQIGLQGINY